MLNLIFALLSLSAFASEVPPHSNEYRCATGQTDERKVSAVVFEAFDANWKPLYSSAEIRDSAGGIDFAGFVSTESYTEEGGGLVYTTWFAPGFRLTGTFIPSQPSRNFGAWLKLESGEQVSLYCTF